ncbi:btk-binding protein-related [Anaeramoeba flamelloides]|uniref:Btk-binding protein-related n=1 Tax=Anaeramoeba flamelloides TaxID=1746091 RepID=A0AAV7YC46_9EUKA|nr:btk-binding protein-related [Anaeramoeba flamelloides]
MSNSSSLYITGSKAFSFVIKNKNNNLPKWTKSNLKKTQTIKKIVCGSGNHIHFLVWKKPNKLEFYQKYNKKKKYQLPKNETIKDIASSFYTYLILTESGKVWSLAHSNRYKEVPLLDADQNTFEKIRHVGLELAKIVAEYQCLFMSKTRLTKSLQESHSYGFFFTTSEPDLLYTCGSNNYGQLGVGSTVDQNTATAVQNFKGSEILTLSSGSYHSILITNEGQTFGCGSKEINGLGVRKTIFTLIPQLKEKKAVQVSTGLSRTLVLTDQNELYGWGFDENLYPTNELPSRRDIPKKIRLPGFFTKYLYSKDQIRIACGSHISFLYLDFKNTLSEDLRILYESKKFCDCEIGKLGNKIPVHKSLVECRTKLTIDQIQNKLFVEKSINKEQTLSFVKWIYSDEISDLEKLEQTFNLLELTFPPSVDNTLENDIAQLYKDNDSKDFTIFVNIEDEEEEEEDEENKKVNYEEIPVHKFILLGRSGLFRAMFDYVNEKENTNKIQDYTNKSIESLKILIKYFYTNSIKLTANQDPEIIVDELSDAVEYYQLNDQCNFELELLKIKKQFDLN